MPPGALRVLAAVGTLAAGGALGGLLGAGAGLVLAPASWWAVRWLQARAGPARLEPELPLCLDLVAALLRGGHPPETSLARVAPMAGGHRDRLAHVAALLGLGADPAQAWSALAGDPWLGEFAAAAVRSASSGIRLAETCERAAADVRAAQHAAAAASAQRAGVLGILPLGLCFLPAFVCIGIVPVVVGIAHTLPIGR